MIKLDDYSKSYPEQNITRRVMREIRKHPRFNLILATRQNGRIVVVRDCYPNLPTNGDIVIHTFQMGHIMDAYINLITNREINIAEIKTGSSLFFSSQKTEVRVI